MRQVHACTVLFGLLILAGCGGGGSNEAQTPAAQTPPSAAPPTADITATSYASTSAGDAALHVQSSKGTSMDFWTQIDANSRRLPAQVLMTDVKGSRIRTVFDSSGSISRIVDESSGRFFALDWQGTQLLISEHDAGGAFLAGYQVAYTSDGKVGIARVRGRAGFSGQLTGQLSGAQPGAYALIGRTSGSNAWVLDSVQVLPDSLQLLLVAAPKPAGLSFGAGPTSHALAAGDTDESGLGLVSTAWQNSLPEQIKQNRGTLFLGFVAGAACAGLVPGCQAAGLAVGAGSLALLVGGYVAQQGGERLINEVRADVGLPALSDGALSGTDRLRGYLANAWVRGDDVAQSMRDAVTTIHKSGASALADLPNLLAERTTATTRSPAAYADPINSAAAASPAPADTQVDGVLATNSGETYSLTGTVKGDGTLHLTGQQDGGATQLAMDGSVQSGLVRGNYNDSTSRSGSFDGSQKVIGQCQTQQQSGGTGSFSYAYAMGAVGGSVTVSYDTYSIPERMDVFTMNAGLRSPAFSTAGLVSDTGGKTFGITPNATVFVAMSAPNSGTQWNFELSCPV